MLKNFRSTNKKKGIKIKKVAQRGRRLKVRYTYCPLLLKSEVYTVTASNYETQNLNLDIYNYLYSNALFQKFKDLYQQYKLNWLRIIVNPIVNEGTYPPIGHGLFLTSDSQSVQYSQIPTMPGSVKIKNNKSTTIFIKNRGRQNDFNYWNDTEGNVSGLSCSYRIRLNQSLPTIENNKVGYTIQIIYALSFRRLYPKEENNKLVLENFETVGLQSEEKENKAIGSDQSGVLGECALSGVPCKTINLEGANKEVKSDLCKIYQKFKPIEVKKLPLDETYPEEIIENDINPYTNCKGYFDNVKTLGKEKAKELLTVSRERSKEYKKMEEEYEYEEVEDKPSLLEEVMKLPCMNKPKKTRRKESHVQQEKKEEKIPWDIKENPILNALIDKPEDKKEENKPLFGNIGTSFKVGKTKKKKKRK